VHCAPTLASGLDEDLCSGIQCCAALNRWPSIVDSSPSPRLGVQHYGTNDVPRSVNGLHFSSGREVLHVVGSCCFGLGLGSGKCSRPGCVALTELG